MCQASLPELSLLRKCPMLRADPTSVPTRCSCPKAARLSALDTPLRRRCIVGVCTADSLSIPQFEMANAHPKSSATSSAHSPAPWFYDQVELEINDANGNGIADLCLIEDEDNDDEPV